MVDDRGDLCVGQLGERRHLRRIMRSADRLAAQSMKHDFYVRVGAGAVNDGIGGKRWKRSRNAGTALSVTRLAIRRVRL